MLHRYAFSNFQSFLEPTEVNLRLNRKVPQVGWDVVSVGGHRLSTVAAVIGANGSGKTALLKPVVFLAWFLKSSFHAQVDASIPVTPHFSAPNEPTEFEFEAEGLDGQLWRYVLRLTPQRVLHEALYLQKVKGFSYVFVREWDESAQHYQVKQQDFGMAPSEARKVRPNASLISTAAQYGVELAQMFTRIHLQTNVVANGRMPFRADRDLPAAAKHFALNQAQQTQMASLLKAWDLGLSDVQVREHTLQMPGEEPQKVWLPFGLHTDRNGRSQELSLFDESSGTQSAFVLLARLLPALADGGLVVIDEFENDLHPHMLEPILDLFANEETNPHQAQIIFTCHAMEVLNVLHKSQVMLVEKNEDCESTAWRMDSVQGIRNDDNFYAKYMAGAYGAVPQF
ncbi:AAA family ATPase [Aquabacterium sp. UBA2148]|uniref:AAA family ATPase n=1 Tax=Aquabacterium sp. UBA2148 TaxID=1946042 RepID=UPI00257F19A0|nr:ATP-binding protein [Aquabacterium sp. UBA2148]